MSTALQSGAFSVIKMLTSLTIICLVILVDGATFIEEGIPMVPPMMEEMVRVKPHPYFCGKANTIPPLARKDSETHTLKHVSVFLRHGDRMRAGAIALLLIFPRPHPPIE